MNITKIRSFFLFASVLLVSIIAMVIYDNYKARANILQQKDTRLPSDVERYINKYTYLQIVDGLEVNIAGKQVIYRGKKMLGLRSNLAKITEFDTLSGTVKSCRVLVSFAASEAEWSLTPSKPLILKQGVTVAIDGKTLSGVNRAHINFGTGILEVFGERNKTINLK